MRWPVSDLGGGPRPDSIHVQYRQGATGMWKTIPKIRGGALSTLITGLTAETEYQVRMQLETHEINSDWSDPSDAVSTDAESLSCELDTRDIWCGVLGVEDGFSSSTNTITIPKGYCGPDSGEIGTPIGELIGTKFAVDETTYTVSCIFWGRGHSSYPEWAEHLWIELDPMPESNTFRPWILKIGDDSFSFADDGRRDRDGRSGGCASFPVPPCVCHAAAAGDRVRGHGAAERQRGAVVHVGCGVRRGGEPDLGRHGDGGGRR